MKRLWKYKIEFIFTIVVAYSTQFANAQAWDPNLNSTDLTGRLGSVSIGTLTSSAGVKFLVSVNGANASTAGVMGIVSDGEFGVVSNMMFSQTRWSGLGDRVPISTLSGVQTTGLRTQWNEYGINFGLVNRSIGNGMGIKDGLISWQDLSFAFPTTAAGQNNSALRFVFRNGQTPDNVGSSSEYMTIAANGNVGIGIATPIVKFQVQGGNIAQVSSGILGVPSSRWSALGSNSTPATGFAVNVSGLTHNWNNRAFYAGLFESAGQRDGLIAWQDLSTTSTASNRLRIGSIVGTGAGANFNEHATFLSNGNVGIGVSNPIERVQVVGNVSITGNVTVTSKLRTSVLQTENFTANSITTNGMNVNQNAIFRGTIDIRSNTGINCTSNSSSAAALNIVSRNSNVSGENVGIRINSLNNRQTTGIDIGVGIAPSFLGGPAVPGAEVFGIRSIASNGRSDFGTFYGVLGIANASGGGGSAGVYYGLYGRADGGTTTINTVTGAGSSYYAVYGQTSNQANNWAGFFIGSVYSTRSISASDKKLKENIKNMEISEDAMLNLMPKTYTFKKDMAENMSLPTEKQMGFIAQDVEKYFPELVVPVIQPEQTDTNGKVVKEKVEFKGINYQGLIPVLWAAMQKQQKTIKEMEKQLHTLKTNKDLAARQGFAIDTLAKNELYQNVPNPFGESTTISYKIVSGSKKADLQVFDLTGRPVKKYELDVKSSKLIIQASEIGVGMYLYALVVDGQLVDSKRMILE